jgi:predicted nucleic acid-binding protein
VAETTKKRLVMSVLDSNAIIYLSKGIIKIDDIAAEELSISVITYMEVLGYNFKSNEELQFVQNLFSLLEIIYIDSLIVEEVISLRKKHNIKLPDAIIAASAITKNIPLVTNDIDLRKIENLKLNLLSIDG